MSFACQLDFETYRPALCVLPDQPARSAPAPLVHRRRVVVAVVAALAVLLVLLALPIRSLGGQSLAQQAPSRGEEYVVHQGDTLASIARRADPAHAATLSVQLTRETGTSVVVPGEHIFIP